MCVCVDASLTFESTWKPLSSPRSFVVTLFPLSPRSSCLPSVVLPGVKSSEVSVSYVCVLHSHRIATTHDAVMISRDNASLYQTFWQCSVRFRSCRLKYIYIYIYIYIYANPWKVKSPSDSDPMVHFPSVSKAAHQTTIRRFVSRGVPLMGGN